MRRRGYFSGCSSVQYYSPLLGIHELPVYFQLSVQLCICLILGVVLNRINFMNENLLWASWIFINETTAAEI